MEISKSTNSKVILVYYTGIFHCAIVDRKNVRDYSNIKIAIDQNHTSLGLLQEVTANLNKHLLRKAS